jgi:nucleoside phosphorylase
MTSRTHHDYTVAWICALPLEMAAAKTMLDEIHEPLPQPPTDQNTYTLGEVSGHNVVIACLPSGVYGVTSAAIVVAHLLPTFPSVKFGLLVGIGGGVPSRDNDIRLGDVVVGNPTASSRGVICYDAGRVSDDGPFDQTGFFDRPPNALLTAIAQMESNYMMSKEPLSAVISNVLDKNAAMNDRFSRPNHDLLFHATYNHQEDSRDCSTSCDRNQLVIRSQRPSEGPQVHYGLIASGNQVIKDPHKRDSIAQQLGILCFEMEAAGLVDQLPCLVIRGICDYCDSHKQKQWQGYAALTAAAYTRELLSVVPVHRATSDQIQSLLHQEVSEEREAFLHWIPTDEYDQMHEAPLEKRSPGTCKWITETKAFQTWRQGISSSLLWCYGKRKHRYQLLYTPILTCFHPQLVLGSRFYCMCILCICPMGALTRAFKQGLPYKTPPGAILHINRRWDQRFLLQLQQTRSGRTISDGVGHA